MRHGMQTAVVAMGLGAVLLAPAGHGAAAELVVRADTVAEVNGQSAIPAGLFGITAYEGADAANAVTLRETLLRSGIRWAGLPAVLGWMFPAEAPPGFKPGWADTAAAAAFLDRNQGGYQIPAAVRAWRDLGIEPMLYLLGYPEWLDGGKRADGTAYIPDLPRDIGQAALVWAEYVALIRRADPGLTWLHLGNEPNAKWFLLGKGGSHYAAIFKTVAQTIKKRNPGVKIGGPVTCWPPSFPPDQAGMPSWYTWDAWAKPLIETAGDELDFFDFHLYGGISSALALEETQTTVNAMWLKTGRRKPVMISEYGAYLTDAEMRSAECVWNRRVAPWQSQVMDFLDLQPDKVLSLQPHDLFALAGGNFRFLKSGDPDNQFALYKMYRVWSALAGRRLLATSTDPAVRVFAATDVSALTGQARLAVVMVNTSDAARRVSLRLDGGVALDAAAPVKGAYVRLADFTGSGNGGPDGGQANEGVQNLELGGAVGGIDGTAAPAPAGAKSAATAGQAVKLADDPARVENGTLVSDRPVTAFLLAPRETRALEYLLSKPAEPTLKRWTRDVFGDVIHQDFEAAGDAIEVRFDLNGAAAGADKAVVRIGLLGARKGDRVTMTIGGATYPLGQDWFQSVPLAAVPSGEKLKAVFTLAARGMPEFRPLKLRFGSATLAFEGCSPFTPDAPPVAAKDAPALASWSLEPARPVPARLENPWGAATQSVENAGLDSFLVDQGIPAAKTLRAVAGGGLRRSACEAVTFRAPADGLYRISVGGKLLSRSAPSAGNAVVSLYVLGRGGAGMREIKVFPLNTPQGHGGYPREFSWQAEVPLQAGWKFAVGLQTVSPGPGNAGASEIELTHFKCEQLQPGARPL